MKTTIIYALDEAERRAKVDALVREPFYVTEGPVVEPGYDIRKMRDLDSAATHSWAFRRRSRRYSFENRYKIPKADF